MRALIPVLLTAAAAAPAQEPDFAALDAQLRFRLADDGRIEIWPDPSRGGEGEEYADLVDPLIVLENGGVLGWLSLVCHGASDVCSLADARAILTRLGRGDDAALFRTIGAHAPSPRARLLRVLAIRAVQDANKTQAIELLERVAKDPGAGPHVRRAATEALATLRGDPNRAAPPRLDTLDSVLRSAPIGLDLVVVVEQFRLPPGRVFAQLARELGLELTKSQIREAGGTVSAAQWAGAVRIAVGTAAAPYELARRFGNHRVDRAVFGLELGARLGDAPNSWLHLDGEFDVASLRAGLAEIGAEPDGDDDHVVFRTEGEGEVTISHDRAVFTSVFREPVRSGADAFVALAAGLEADGAAVRAALGDIDASLLPRDVTEFGVPTRVAFWIDASRLRLQVGFRDRKSAQLVQQLGSDLPRTLDAWLDRNDAPEAFDDLVETLEQMRVTRDGATVTLAAPIEGLDVRSLLLTAARDGML